MINRNDLVLVYQNGEIHSATWAGAVRGFLGDKISIGNYDYFRATGVCTVDKEWTVRSVTREEWEVEQKKIRAFLEERKRQEAEVERQREIARQVLLAKAQVWYDGLPAEQQDMIRALSVNYQPTAD